MRMTMTRCAAFLALLALWLNPCSASLSTVLESGSEECFIVRAPSDEPAIITGNYDCLDDELSSDPISVKLKDEKGRLLWKSMPGQSESTFDIHVKTGGRFSLCLHHKGDDEDLDRTVGFAVRVRSPSRALADMVQGPDGEKALELIEWAEDLTEEWDTLMDHYDYLRSREAVQEELAEKIFQRVMRWTVVEALLLISIATAQVMYFRKFFEKRRYL